MAFTSFSLCLIVAALECRSETGTVLTTATFDSKQMNWTLLAEFVLSVLVTQMDVFNRLLDTTPINLAAVRVGAGAGPDAAGRLGGGQGRRPPGRRPAPAVGRSRCPRIDRAAAEPSHPGPARDDVTIIPGGVRPRGR